jgi:hypothetical protein
VSLVDLILDHDECTLLVHEIFGGYACMQESLKDMELVLGVLCAFMAGVLQASASRCCLSTMRWRKSGAELYNTAMKEILHFSPYSKRDDL